MKFHERNILHIVKTVEPSWATITNNYPHVIFVNFKLVQAKHLVSGQLGYSFRGELPRGKLADLVVLLQAVNHGLLST